MTPERWQRVNEVLQGAWEYAGNDRAAFLDRACLNDPDLRHKVESLLASDEGLGEFLASPALHSAEFRTAAVGREIGPYRIVREIGHGGMGIVYLAERADGQYCKRVAIKALDSRSITADALRRLRNERQVEAALDHPNIARLLDGGATNDGLPYLVLEYVDGVRIDRWCDGRKLTVHDRLNLFQQVCSAVQYTHDKGILHRDIKAGNILVTSDGIAKLLDFGIAKVLDGGLSLDAETTVGAAPMTPEYASPEQARGERVGPASDIYALGVVLYDLLTGRLPYSVQQLASAQIARPLNGGEPVKPSAAIAGGDGPGAADARGVSLSSLRRQLTGDLDDIVLKALRDEPARRYSSAAQLSDDIGRYLEGLPVRAHRGSSFYRARRFLKRNRERVITAVLGAALVLAFAAVRGRLGTREGGTNPGVPSIAVLPLENLSGDRDQEYFADGMTETLIGELARIAGLRVISRTSVMSFKGAGRSIAEIAKALGVRMLAEGAVLRTGSRIRLSVRVVDAAKDRPVWSGSYEGELQDVMRLQQQVAAAVAAQIHGTMTGTGKAAASPNRRVDIGAYDAYLKGRHQYSAGFTRESIQKAIAWFQQALALDPGYAPAYAGLADCYFGLSNIYYPPVEVMPRAKRAAGKALELDDTLGEAHAILALVSSVYEFKRGEAETEFRRAIELNPSDPETHLWYAQHLTGMGRFDQAVSEVGQAEQLDPISAGIGAYAGYALYLARRYDQAVQRLQSIVDRHPDYHQPHAFLALAYEQRGDWASAIREMEKAYRLDQEPEALAQLGHIYASAGRKADARRTLGRLMALSRRRYVSVYNIAVLYAGLEDRDQAFRWLQKVEEDRSEWFAAVNVDPRLDGLHSDPRFAAILRQVGLTVTPRRDNSESNR